MIKLLAIFLLLVQTCWSYDNPNNPADEPSCNENNLTPIYDGFNWKCLSPKTIILKKEYNYIECPDGYGVDWRACENGNSDGLITGCMIICSKEYIGTPTKIENTSILDKAKEHLIIHGMKNVIVYPEAFWSCKKDNFQAVKFYGNDAGGNITGVYCCSMDNEENKCYLEYYDGWLN